MFISSRQFIETFPAGWSPQKVVNSKGMNPTQNGRNIQVKDLFHKLPRYNLLINGVYSDYNPLTNLLLTSWDIQVAMAYGNHGPFNG